MASSREIVTLRSVTTPCPAHVLARQAGLSIDEICQRASQRGRGMSRTYFLKLARDGGANYAVARRLAAICQCDIYVFLRGYNAWQHLSQPRSSRLIPHSKASIVRSD